MNVFDRPTAANELAGQPIQQGGMRRPLALDAEVARRSDQAVAEVIHPNSIDHHASGQRVFRRGDPIRQSQPPFSIGNGLFTNRLMTSPISAMALSLRGSEL